MTAHSQSLMEKKDYASTPTQKGMQIAVASGKNKILLYIRFSKGLSTENIKPVIRNCSFFSADWQPKVFAIFFVTFSAVFSFIRLGFQNWCPQNCSWGVRNVITKKVKRR